MISQKVSPILLMTTYEDEPYLGQFKPYLKGRRAFQISANPDTAAEIELYARSQGITHIISTNPTVLNKVTSEYTSRRQSLDNWAGSLWERGGITYLFLNPLKQLYSVPYGRFISSRFTSKLISPNEWTRTPPFSWEPARADTIQHWFDLFSKAILCAIDIETRSWDDDPENSLKGERHTLIRSVAYTGLWEDGNVHTIVIPIGDASAQELGYWTSWMRHFNLLSCPKIFQNGLYDNWHFIQYRAPVKGYLFDTQSLFHSWYSELPKSLDFIAAFTIYNSFYWKDLAKEGALHKQWEYNARDGWATLVSFLNLMDEMPEWAIQNYLLKFPLWIPCLDMNLEGIKCDETQRKKLIEREVSKLVACEARLQKWFGSGFNPRSPKQVTDLMSFYGSSDITSSSEPELRKFGLRHPLNGKFANEILRSRELSKSISTYLKPSDISLTKNKSSKKRSPLLHRGRIYYALNPDGTDTARLSCGEGSGWTGMQIQNQPRDSDSVKGMMISDGPEWRLFEIDNTTSEQYTVAYTSGDASLLETLRMCREEGKDFHKINASKFFGFSYEDVPKEIRDDAAKRVTFGSNYNMQAPQLLRTMGEKNVDNARRLLGLPSYTTRIEVCEFLLQTYIKAYPDVKGAGYRAIINAVESNRKLVSALGWTRYCFGNPARNRQDLNAYVAHVPQNLSVLVINQALKNIYWRIRMPNARNFRLKAQIHDSIFGQVRVGYEHLVLEARKLATIPIPVTDCKGIKRTMCIPVAAKIGKSGGSWTEMEKFE